MGKAYRDLASFGKRIEYKIIGDMLMEGLDCYVPLVDDHGVDLVIKKQDGNFIEVQIKARGFDIKPENAAGFAGVCHTLTPNYYFVFYSELLNCKWIMSSEEFIENSIENKNGKHKGKRSLWINGCKKEKETGKLVPYCKTKFEKFIATDFSRFR